MKKEMIKVEKNRPIKDKGYKNAKRIAKLNKKRKEANERNAKWQKLSLDAKISSLKDRPGASKKQLNKLKSQLKT